MSIWNDEQVVERLFELKNEDYTEAEIAEILTREYNLDVTSEAVGRKYRHLRDLLNREVNLSDISDRNANLIKQLQRTQDKQRVERAGIRTLARYENFFEDFNTKLQKLLSGLSASLRIEEKKYAEGSPIGILHLSDLHLNEIVSVADNNFDINVANKRLHKYLTKSINIFLQQGVSKVIIACTGDFITNDKKLDQLTSLAINRAQSVFLGVSLLKNIILHLNGYFDVVVAGVTGNESRVQYDLGYNNFIASDNYDMTIYNIIKYLFADKIKVITDNANELILNIHNQNVLLTHGYSIAKNTPEKSVMDLYSKYAKLGINLRYAIFGHYHVPFISADFSRTGSLIGTNSYAMYGINASGRACQSLYLLFDNGDIDSILVDLQNAEYYTGYDLGVELAEFDIRVVNKVNELVAHKI